MTLTDDELKKLVIKTIKTNSTQRPKKSDVDAVCTYLNKKLYQIQDQDTATSSIIAYLQEYSINGKKHDFPKEYDKYRKVNNKNKKDANIEECELNKLCKSCGTKTVRFIKTIYPSGDEAAKQVYKCSKCRKQIVTS